MRPSARSGTGSGDRQRPSMTSPTGIEAWLQHAAWEADASCLLKFVLKSVRTLTECKGGNPLLRSYGVQR